MNNMDCILCKIIDGEIPSYKIFEDDKVLAFLDISQGTKGHTLLIPKKHVRNVYELDETTAADIFKVVPKIARALKEAFNPIGINIVNNNEKPLQEVFHYHIHLIPRYENDGMILSTISNFGKVEKDEFENRVSKIKEYL